MKFITGNYRTINPSGTHLQGTVECAYSTLVSIFGPAGEGDGEKTDAEWVLQFEDGKVATIYNYKDGVAYNGAEGTATEEITDWHIGGLERVVVDRIKELIVKPVVAESGKTIVQITVVEKRQAIIYAELPKGKTIEQLEQELEEAGIDWNHFEKRADTLQLDTSVLKASNVSDDELREWNYLHEVGDNQG